MTTQQEYLEMTHKQILDKVQDRGYYLDLLPPIPQRDPTTFQMLHFWDKFWDNLPDSPNIHREPFYEICGFIKYLNESVYNDIPF